LQRAALQCRIDATIVPLLPQKEKSNYSILAIETLSFFFRG